MGLIYPIRCDAYVATQGVTHIFGYFGGLSWALDHAREPLTL